MAESKTTEQQGNEQDDLLAVRRRLSVVSDNRLVEGISGLAVEDKEVPFGNEAPMSELIVKSYAGVSKKGYAPYNPRKKNQDAIIMAEDDETQSLFLCVFDGHGEAGDAVSYFFKKEMPARLFAHKDWATNVQSAITSVTSKLEREICRDASIDTEFSGTTAVMCVIRGTTLTVANIGDSRITAGIREGTKLTGVPLSDDHKPDRPDEKARIEERGGRVFAVEYDDGVDGPQRVWLGHMDVPGLAMSRSLGDAVAHSAGVISTPEYTTRELQSSTDEMLIIASDGLWEFVTDQEAVDMVSGSGKTDPREVVDLLIEEANQRWMKEEQVIDDTSVIVVFLNK